jgi:hypothetical protein
MTELGEVTFVDRESGSVVILTAEEFADLIGLVLDGMKARANVRWSDEEIDLEA